MTYKVNDIVVFEKQNKEQHNGVIGAIDIITAVHETSYVTTEKEPGGWWIRNIRLATQEEINFYNSGGRDIKNMTASEKISLRKEDLIPGEIYFYSYSGWSSDYIEGYKIDGKYPTIRRSKNSSGGWVFIGSSYGGYFSNGRPGFYCRKATEEEKYNFLFLMAKEGISIPTATKSEKTETIAVDIKISKPVKTEVKKSLEFQTPVIINTKKSNKFKLTII